MIKFANFIQNPIFDSLVRTKVYTVQITVRDYLKIVDLEENPFQRNVLDYDVYYKLIKDILAGAVFPPISVVSKVDVDVNKGLDENSKVLILDGLQRTNCLFICLNVLQKKIKVEIPTIYKDVNQFLDRLITLEIWENLELKSILYKIIVLNTGQKRMDARHQLDIMTSFIKDFLKEKDIKFIELKEKLSEEITKTELQETNTFPLHSIAEGLVAYVNKYPQFTQKSTIEFLFDKLDLEPGSYKDGIKIIESEKTYLDLVWVLKDLSVLLLNKYKHNVLIKHPLFLASLLAAIGYVRYEIGEKQIEDKKPVLASLIKSDIDDPLGLTAFNTYYNEFKSNIGAKRRKLVFIAFKNYLSSPSSLKLDWYQAYLETK